jgi:hypothetical protein
MDPISLVVSTLAAGALAALKPTAEQAVKDAYGGLKSLIQRRYGSVDLSQIEKKPKSSSKQESVAEDLREAGAEVWLWYLLTSWEGSTSPRKIGAK